MDSMDIGVLLSYGFLPMKTATPNQKGQRWPRSLPNPKDLCKIFAALQTVYPVWGVSRLWVLATPGGGAFSSDMNQRKAGLEANITIRRNRCQKEGVGFGYVRFWANQNAA